MLDLFEAKGVDSLFTFAAWLESNNIDGNGFPLLWKENQFHRFKVQAAECELPGAQNAKTP